VLAAAQILVRVGQKTVGLKKLAKAFDSFFSRELNKFREKA